MNEVTWDRSEFNKTSIKPGNLWEVMSQNLSLRNFEVFGKRIRLIGVL